MRKPDFCKGENNGADQLRSNCEADQRRCFHYMDSTISLLPKSKISSFWPFSETVQTGLCWTWSENPEDQFSRVAAHVIAIPNILLNTEVYLIGLIFICLNDNVNLSGFLTRSDINQPAQSQEKAKSLKFWN